MSFILSKPLPSILDTLFKTTTAPERSPASYSRIPFKDRAKTTLGIFNLLATSMVDRKTELCSMSEVTIFLNLRGNCPSTRLIPYVVLSVNATTYSDDDLSRMVNIRCLVSFTISSTFIPQSYFTRPPHVLYV